jgi:hypothetical protein
VGLALVPILSAQENQPAVKPQTTDILKQAALLAKPLRDASKLTLSTLPEGYHWTIKSTHPMGIIANDGTITRPSQDTNVEVTLEAVSQTNPAETATLTLTVPIDKSYTPPTMSTAQAKANRERYERHKYGLFVHYVPGLTTDLDGKHPSIDSLTKDLDAKQFAQDMSDFGVEYVIFTVMHANACTLYPSDVNKRWRDNRRASGGSDNVKTYSDTDLIARLATELEKKGIDLHLYVHPVDGHDFSAEDQNLTGWNDCSKEHETWNTFQNELFDELCHRYGEHIKGLWFDGMFVHTTKTPNHNCIQQDRLRETLLAYNPGLVLVGNVAGDRSGNLGSDWRAVDYRSWECGDVTSGLGLSVPNSDVHQEDAMTWPGTTKQVALVVGSSWWASDKNAQAKYSPENLFQYLVLQASISKSGGVAFAAGCFPGSAKENKNGNLWEGNIYETMIALGKYIKPIAESIKNTVGGKAYVTREYQWLNQTAWGVSTESADGTTVYLHVIKPPASGTTLPIGQTADGSTLGGKAILLNTGKPVTFKKTATGYEISLPEGSAWDGLDTVIKVQRMPPNPIISP